MLSKDVLLAETVFNLLKESMSVSEIVSYNKPCVSYREKSELLRCEFDTIRKIAFEISVLHDNLIIFYPKLPLDTTDLRIHRRKLFHSSTSFLAAVLRSRFSRFRSV